MGLGVGNAGEAAPNPAAISGAVTITGTSNVQQLTVVANSTQTNPEIQVKLSTGNNVAAIGRLVGAPTYGAVYLGNNLTPSGSNYTITSDGVGAVINGSTGVTLASSGNAVASFALPSSLPAFTLGTARLYNPSSKLWNFDDGAAGNADLQFTGQFLTAGTLTQTAKAYVRSVWHRYDWTNAMVVALGAGLTGDITVATLQAKTIIENVYVVITGTASGTATLTVACGRTSAAYIDYIVASDAKVAANTFYGGASGERGTNLTGYDLPSFTGNTAVKLHFISTVDNLDQCLGSTGSVYIKTSLLP